jgi:hypothetical protein
VDEVPAHTGHPFLATYCEERIAHNLYLHGNRRADAS